MEKGISGSLEKSVISLSRRQQGFKSPGDANNKTKLSKSMLSFICLLNTGYQL